MDVFTTIYQQLPPQWQWPYRPELWRRPLDSRSCCDRIAFVYPENTTAVRCTATCSLQCGHCNGHYLEGMLPFYSGINSSSLLVSGGCDSFGRVPFHRYKDELTAWKQQDRSRRLNFHVGLVRDEDLPALADLADVVSFDFVWDQETIDNVYGLPASPDDYLRTYRSLKKATTVIPHICIGLHGGRLGGEHQALECLQREGAEALAFIVFVPTPGTRFAQRKPPNLGQTAELLAAARRMFPKTTISLGCMRPAGRYRYWLDALAVAAGVDRIVHPTPLARQWAAKIYSHVQEEKECCSL